MKSVEKHAFNAAPLPMVWLINGFTVREQFGRRSVRYEDVHGLMSALESAVVAKPALLSGEEIAFLRRAMELSQSALAEVLGTSEQTLSLWERGSHRIIVPADIVLRGYFMESRFGTASRHWSIVDLSKNAHAIGQYMYEGQYALSKWAFEAKPVAKQRRVAHVFADVEYRQNDRLSPRVKKSQESVQLSLEEVEVTMGKHHLHSEVFHLERAE